MEKFGSSIIALSKQQLRAGKKRTRLSLEEKIKILNYSNENSKKSCREIAVQFQIGEAVASSILKDGKRLRKEFEFFKGNCKTKRAGQFNLINETLYKWYGNVALQVFTRLDQCYKKRR